MIRNLLVIFLTFLPIVSQAYDPETRFTYDQKLYVDDSELKSSDDSFYIHTGGNLWIQTKEIHRDSTGLFTYSHNITRSLTHHKAMKKRWKCPYCFMWWDEGQRCQNEFCPSRY